MAGGNGPPDLHVVKHDGSRRTSSDHDRDAWRADSSEKAADLRLAQQLLDIVIWKMELETGRLVWCGHAHNVFGVARKDLPADFGAYLDLVHADDREGVAGNFLTFPNSKASLLKFEYRVRRQDGSVIHVRGVAEREEKDGASWLTSVVQDVTAEVTSREELVEAHRMQQIAKSRLHQAQKLEAVGQLTGGIVHDFNNLLTVILGNAEMLGDELRNRPELKQLADAITATGDRAADLTKRLLAFSRKQPLQPRLIDMGAQIQGTERLLRRALPENIEREIVCAPGLWAAEVDPSQLESAVLNLVLNARDAMPEGGHLTIETANVTVDDSVPSRAQDLAAAQYVRIIVTDTGAGITPDALARVFEPFFTTKEVGKGSGLGLSMVHGFVKQSGGHISVRSKQGKGTSFTLHFPRATGTGTHIRSVSSSGKQIVGGDESILVVEDDTSVREHLVAELEGLGYWVTASPPPRRALKRWKSLSRRLKSTCS